MNKFERFLEALKTDPRAKELSKGMKKPENDEEMADCYLAIATELGFGLTKAEITEGISAAIQEQKAKSAKAAETLGKATLDEDDLEQVAGGKNEGCEDTHQYGEWCWWTDFCFLIITDYGSSNEYYYGDPNGKARDSYYDPHPDDLKEFDTPKEEME